MATTEPHQWSPPFTSVIWRWQRVPLSKTTSIRLSARVIIDRFDTISASGSGDLGLAGGGATAPLVHPNHRWSYCERWQRHALHAANTAAKRRRGWKKKGKKRRKSPLVARQQPSRIVTLDIDFPCLETERSFCKWCKLSGKDGRNGPAATLRESALTLFTVTFQIFLPGC